MWPGKAKPAPSFSAFLWMGEVQIAEAAPDWTSETARAMTATTSAALPGVGCPGGCGSGKRCKSTGNASAGTSAASKGAVIPCHALPSGRCAGSPIQKKGSRFPSACRALTAISGPMPAGSPQVRAIGAITAGG